MVNNLEVWRLLCGKDVAVKDWPEELAPVGSVLYEVHHHTEGVVQHVAHLAKDNHSQFASYYKSFRKYEPLELMYSITKSRQLRRAPYRTYVTV